MATTPVILDAETMDMNELRKLAEEEARKATTTTTTTPPTTTEVTPGATGEEEEETTTTTTVPEVKTAPKVFYAERTIDLGDGAGVQVFRGKGASREDALEEALDKVTDAQRNATKKIREQAARLKAQEPVKGEEESLLAAEIVTHPSKVVKNILGVDPSELKEVVAELKQNRANKQKVAVGNQFVSTHPEFLDNERNGKRLFKAASLFGEFSLENLEKAYQDLTESGLLEVKGEEASAEQKKAQAEQQRIAEAAEATSSQRTRKASGLSTHSRSAPVANTEPSEDELASMPLEKLRALANKHLAGQ